MQQEIAVVAQCRECGRQWWARSLSLAILESYQDHVAEHGRIQARRTA